MKTDASPSKNPNAKIKNSANSSAKPEEYVQFLRTSFVFKVLASVKFLQTSNKCRGAQFSDIVEAVSNTYNLTGDIESQVRHAISTAVSLRFLLNKGDQYYLVPPAAKVHSVGQEASNNEINRIDNIFNYCKSERHPNKRRHRHRSRSRSRGRSGSRNRSRSPINYPRRSKSPTPVKHLKEKCDCASSLENLKNKILGMRLRKRSRRPESGYSLRPTEKEVRSPDFVKRDGSGPNTTVGYRPCVKFGSAKNGTDVKKRVGSRSSSSNSSSSC